MKSSRPAVAPSADYDLVAAEYYDPQRHPTCANFGELSARFVGARLLQVASPDARIVEVGAGRSIVAPLLAAAGRRLESLTLLDESATMLAYSAEWKGRGVKMLVADACATSLPSGGYELVVAALCDPYNRPAFWQEAARLLAGGSVCLATLPSFEWASQFRAKDARDVAEFVLANGRSVAMPSFVVSAEAQRAMIEAAGLRVIEQAAYSASDLQGAASWKLNVFASDERGPVVRGFMAAKS